MTLRVFLMLMAAAGVGAMTRFGLDGWIRSAMTTRYQWATMIINLSGSLALGFLTGLSDVDVVSAAWYLVVGTGFLGGYTTFSTASYETVSLIRARQHGRAVLSSVGMLAGCIALAAFGLWLGSGV